MLLDYLSLDRKARLLDNETNRSRKSEGKESVRKDGNPDIREHCAEASQA